ncbi:MAG TPA: substrate-binding domain-containing protein, partial [Chitinophagaceae bacterium]|nr:substrate-binding domain-containing protein [Chitinophagaceae bacterium]
AIVGFNNDPICRLVTPQLSTINYPGEAMGKTAANHLINILEGKSSLSEINTITLKSDLIIRASSLKAECKK